MPYQPFSKGDRLGKRNLRRDKDRRNLTQFNMQTLPKSAKQKERDRMRLQKKFQKQLVSVRSGTRNPRYVSRSPTPKALFPTPRVLGQPSFPAHGFFPRPATWGHGERLGHPALFIDISPKRERKGKPPSSSDPNKVSPGLGTLCMLDPGSRALTLGTFL
ncbi:hypothetical protein J4Q44_G00176520 [Coregonus suidteri]|uniref:Uncharacterized protein n=1 Tax=Coregonus suidteri TaxID=861788 RepID=A0AAN8QV54_9TELE